MDLTNYRVFQNLNRTQIENFVAACTEQVHAAGTEIITRGGRGQHMFFLLEGELRVHLPGTKPTELAVLKPPAVVGEMELLTDMPRSASVTAATEVRVLGVPFETLRTRLKDEDPATLKIMYNVATVLALRLSATVSKLVELENAPETRSEELSEFRKKLFSEWSF